MQQISTVRREFQVMSLKKVFIEEKLGHPQQICHFRKFRIIVFIDNILRKSEQPAFIRFTGLGTNGAAGFRRNVSQIFGCAGSGTFAEIQAYTKKIKKIKFEVRLMHYPIIFIYKIKKTVNQIVKAFQFRLFGHAGICQFAESGKRGQFAAAAEKTNGSRLEKFGAKGKHIFFNPGIGINRNQVAGLIDAKVLFAVPAPDIADKLAVCAGYQSQNKRGFAVFSDIDDVPFVRKLQIYFLVMTS